LIVNRERSLFGVNKHRFAHDLESRELDNNKFPLIKFPRDRVVKQDSYPPPCLS
jgi:hypothetical protein